MRERRGLYLASTATQKGDLSALASLTDTSESEDSGLHDKQPVLTQACRMSSVLCVRCFTLAVNISRCLFSGTWLAAQAGNPRAVSPCGLAPDRQHWLVSQQGALAHVHSSTPVLKRQAYAPDGGANSSPCLKTGDSLAQLVDYSNNHQGTLNRRASVSLEGRGHE